MSGTPDRRFLRLVDDPGDTLLRAARLLCGDWTQAEDVLQRALARTLARWDDRHGDTEAARLARRELVVTYLDGPPGCEAASAPARDHVCGHARVVDQLGALEPEVRAVVVARHYLRLSERDTAAALGTDPAHVREVEHRCLTWLAATTPWRPSHVS